MGIGEISEAGTADFAARIESRFDEIGTDSITGEGGSVAK